MNTSSSSQKPDPDVRTGSTKSSTGDSYSELRSDISNLSHSVKKFAGEQFGSVAGDAQKQAEQKLGDIESAVRRNPVQSALIAAGLGLVVGLILTR
jgi:ElaB/YqjD/DUF883 family membrane-anchored ribosome-binding protein